MRVWAMRTGSGWKSSRSRRALGRSSAALPGSEALDKLAQADLAAVVEAGHEALQVGGVGLAGERALVGGLDRVALGGVAGGIGEDAGPERAQLAQAEQAAGRGGGGRVAAG